MVLGYDIQNGDKVGDGQGKAVETNTGTETTTKGNIHCSTTKTTEQPKGAPVMVYNKANGLMGDSQSKEETLHLIAKKSTKSA